MIGERSRAALGLSNRWIIKSMIPAGALLLLLAGLDVTFRNIKLLSRPGLNPPST